MGDARASWSRQAGRVIAPPLPLVWAKLRPPMPPKGVVERPDLIGQLAVADVALTAIVAPPGYGKTTTAVELARAVGGETAWVTLESTEADPVRFWTYVAAALAAAGVAGADAIYERLASPEGVESGRAALRAAIEKHRSPVTLVLDDLHSIEGSPQVEQGLSAWLRHPSENLRLVCTSRGDLPLPVGRLRSQGLLTEARAADLAFNATEASSLLERSFGLDALTHEQVASLEHRTEGWPTGLYLAGLTLRDEPNIAEQIERFTGDRRHLSEYLGDEVMKDIDPETRAFVLATSVLSVLEPDLCDAVTGQHGSLRVLRDLVAGNMFTSALDEGATIFRFHPLFRDHLRSALAADHPEQVSLLHRRASRWFEARGDIDEAIVHASAAGDVQRAEELIGSTSIRFVNAGHFDTVIGWVRRLGPVSELSTQTCLVMAWIMLNQRRPAECDEWISNAERVAIDEVEQRIVAFQKASVCSHRARHVGDVGTMVSEAERARAIVASSDGFSESDSAVGEMEAGFLGSEAGLGAVLSVSAAAAFWSGDLDASRSYLIDSLAIARELNMIIEVVFCYLYLAMIEAELGDADAAMAHADQALALIPDGEERHHQPTLAHLALSVAQLQLGRPADASDALSEAQRLAAMREEPLHDVAIALQEARVLHRTGDAEGARAALRNAKSLVVELPDPQFEARVRAVEAEIRFVPRELEGLPVGARELSDREQAVLLLLPHGLSRRELAGQLHVSENTVKTHLTSIRHKLGVSGRDSIVDRARELGLLSPLG